MNVFFITTSLLKIIGMIFVVIFADGFLRRFTQNAASAR